MAATARHCSTANSRTIEDLYRANGFQQIKITSKVVDDYGGNENELAVSLQSTKVRKPWWAPSIWKATKLSRGTAFRLHQHGGQVSPFPSSTWRTIGTIF